MADADIAAMVVMSIAYVLHQLWKFVEGPIAKLAGVCQDLSVGPLDCNIFKEKSVERVTLPLSFRNLAQRLEAMNVVFVVVEPQSSQNNLTTETHF